MISMRHAQVSVHTEFLEAVELVIPLPRTKPSLTLNQPQTNLDPQLVLVPGSGPAGTKWYGTKKDLLVKSPFRQPAVWPECLKKPLEGFPERETCLGLVDKGAFRPPARHDSTTVQDMGRTSLPNQTIWVSAAFPWLAPDLVAPQPRLHPLRPSAHLSREPPKRERALLQPKQIRQLFRDLNQAFLWKLSDKQTCMFPACQSMWSMSHGIS